MSDLTSAQYAVLLDQDDHTLLPANFTVTSSDAVVCSVGEGPGFVIAAVGQSAGSATLSATRHSDGATAELVVTVEAAAGAGFAIHLGTPATKG